MEKREVKGVYPSNGFTTLGKWAPKHIATFPILLFYKKPAILHYHVVHKAPTQPNPNFHILNLGKMTNTPLIW
jgi:hypothetical protein